MQLLRSQVGGKLCAGPGSFGISFTSCRGLSRIARLAQPRLIYTQNRPRSIDNRVQLNKSQAGRQASHLTATKERLGHGGKILLQFASSRYRHFSTGRASQHIEPANPGEPIIDGLFDPTTGSWQYVIGDPLTSAAAIIDPVLDYDPATQAISTQNADSLLSLVKEKKYHVDRILETHAHADHLTAASYIQSHLARQQGYRPPIGIGKRIGQVQKLFAQRYGIPLEEYENVFDTLYDDEETFDIGDLVATVTHLPGHTPDLVGYRIGGKIHLRTLSAD